MATDLETLVVELVADVRGYQAELQKSSQQTRDWSTDVQRQTASVGRAFAALGLGAVATGLAVITRRALDVAEQTQRMAVSLGANVESVQELGFAFREFGLDADDVADALNTLADRSEDAQAGTKSFIDDFKLLGVSVEQLRGLKPEEIFGLVAQEVAKIEDPTQRAAGIVRIFGDDLGRRLLPLLIQGREGLAGLAEEARNLGVVLDAEAIDSMAAANREFRQLRSLVDAQLARAVADNAENLKSLAVAMGDVAGVAIASSGNIAEFVRWVGEELAATLHGVSDDDVPRLIGALDEARDRLKDMERLFSQPVQSYRIGPVVSAEELEAQKQLVESLERRLELAQNLQRQESRISEIDTSGFPSRRSVAGGGGEVVEQFKLSRQAALHTQRLMDEEQRELDQTQKILDVQQERFQRIHEMALESTDDLVALERYRFDQQKRELAEEEERLREHNLLTLDLERQFEQAREELEQTHVARLDEIRQQQVDRINEGNVFEELSAHADQAARNMQDAFADFLFDPFEDGLQGMLDSFIDTLQRMVAEMAASQIFDLLGGLSGSGNGILSSIGSFFSGRREHGGGVGAHQAYIVGEKRPEIFVPGISGSVLPGLGGGGNVYVNVEHSGGAEPQIDVSETMQGLDRMINVRIMQGISDAFLSGAADRAMAVNYGARRRPSR